MWFIFFFFNDTATTEIYPLSLHDALPISKTGTARHVVNGRYAAGQYTASFAARSEEHTSELQSQSNLVCRLLLEKKNKTPDNSLRHPRDEPPSAPFVRGHRGRSLVWAGVV